MSTSPSLAMIVCKFCGGGKIVLHFEYEMTFSSCCERAKAIFDQHASQVHAAACATNQEAIADCDASDCDSDSDGSSYDSEVIETGTDSDCGTSSDFDWPEEESSAGSTEFEGAYHSKIHTNNRFRTAFAYL